MNYKILLVLLVLLVSTLSISALEGDVSGDGCVNDDDVSSPDLNQRLQEKLREGPSALNTFLWSLHNNWGECEELWPADKDLYLRENYNMCLPINLRTELGYSRDGPLHEDQVQAIQDYMQDVVNQHIEMSDEELIAPITDGDALLDIYAESGNADYRAAMTENKRMRDVAYYFACLYDENENPEYAQKSLTLLKKFAEVFPTWPMHGREMIDESWGGLTLISREDIIEGNFEGYSNDNKGLWNTNFNIDLDDGHPLLFSYYLLNKNNYLNGDDVILLKGFGRELVDFTWDNLFGGDEFFTIGSMRMLVHTIPYGIILEDSEYIDNAVEMARQMFFVGFYRDGMWREGAISYQASFDTIMIRDFSSSLPNKLEGYLDLREVVGEQFNRIKNSLEPFALPTSTPRDYFYAVHDTTHIQPVWSYYNYDTTKSEPHLLSGVGFGVLGRGEDLKQSRAYLDFTGYNGHAQLDNLNLGIWASNGELFSENTYRGIDRAYRAWYSSTPNHNTVVIDEQNQLNNGDTFFPLTADDYIDGMDKLIYQQRVWRAYNTKIYGNLKLWNFAPGIQFMEADGKNAYGPEIHRDVSKNKPRKADIYQRSVAMIDTGDDNVYYIDTFRVKGNQDLIVEGGQTHDWMLHGRLNEDYDLWTDLDMQPIAEERYKLTSGNPEFDTLVDVGMNFDQQAITDETWSSEFISNELNTRMRTTMLSHPNTEVSFARSLATRRPGDAWYIDVRRTTGDTVFVAVHEPYLEEDGPKISEIVSLIDAQLSDDVVAFKVILENGKTDYIAAALTEPENPVVISDDTVNIKFQGRFMHVRMNPTGEESMYVVEGKGICVNDIPLSSVDASLSYTGRISDIKRIEKGDADNSFITDIELPTDGSLDGKTLLLTLGDERTQGYTINRVEPDNGNYKIHVNEEPGLEIRDSIAHQGEKMAKFVFYPWHGVLGPVDFMIIGEAYRNADGEVISTAELDEVGICE